MKKVICVLAGLAALCSGLFAESIKKEIDIKDDLFEDLVN